MKAFLPWAMMCALSAAGCGSETSLQDAARAEQGADSSLTFPDGRADAATADGSSDRAAARDCGASCKADGPAGPDPILIGASDIAICGNSGAEQTAKLLDAAFASKPAGAVFTAGDNSNESGTAAQFNNCFHPTWGRHKALIHPSPGNHDYSTAGASGYFGYYGAAAGDPKQGYYSYSLGAWHVVVLNGNCSQVGGCQAGSAQEKWLRADLAANPATCTLAHWHQPRFSSGGLHGSDTAYQPLWQALYDLGADVVVNGHDHHYERFAPQTPAGAADAAKGVREFIIGTGGAGTRALGTIRANSEVRNSSTLGVLKLTLRAASYDWEFIPVAGKTFKDSGTTACH